MTESTKIDYVSIVQDLRDEADLCRNETATDIADLLDDAASCIVAMKSQFTALRSELAAAQEAIAAKDAELASVKAENARLRVDANKKQPYANGEVVNQLKTWQRLAFELSQSIVALSVVKDGVTFFQKDPIKDQETFHLWRRLNDAQTAVLDAYRAAHPKDAP